LRLQAARELPAAKLIFGSFSPELDPRVETYAVTMLDLAEQEKEQDIGRQHQTVTPPSEKPKSRREPDDLHALMAESLNSNEGT